MNHKSHYERKSPLSRLKELFTLSLFTIIAALVSIVAMDLLVLPISLFAVNHKSAFNYIIREISVFIIFLIIVLMLILKLVRMHRDGIGLGEILKYMFLRPLRAFLSFIMLMVAGALILYILSLLLNFNYYRIYLFTQS